MCQGRFCWKLTDVCKTLLKTVLTCYFWFCIFYNPIHSHTLNNENKSDALPNDTMEPLHLWVSGKDITPTDSDDRNPLSNHMHWVTLHAAYGRTEFGIHRITWVTTCLAILYGVMALIGLVSNILVAYILLFIRRRALSNITNIFVLVLAVSDMVLCGFNIPVQAYYELKETARLNSMACKIVFSMFGLPMHVSCLTILLIACDRYQIIIYPLYPRISTNFAIFLVVMTVVISIVNLIPIAMYSIVSEAIRPPPSPVTLPNGNGYGYIPAEIHTYCIEMWPNPESRLVYSVAAVLIHFFIPLLLTAVLYGHIFFRLHERRFQKSSVERKRRTNKILVRIVVCFAICWTPWICFSLWMETNAFLLHHVSRNAVRALQSNKQIESNYSRNEESHAVHWGPIEFADSHTQMLTPQAMAYLMAIEKTMKYQRNAKPGERLLISNTSETADGVPFIDSQQEANLQSQREYFLPTFGVYANEGKIKFIDLLLRILAMGSSCVNPWLYGWLNKFLFSVSRHHWRKMVRQMNFTEKIKELGNRIKQINIFTEADNPASNERPRQSNESALVDDLAVTENDIRFGNRNRNSLSQTCYCCGAYCTCQLVFNKKIVFQGRTSHIKSSSSRTHARKRSSKETSNKESQRVAESGERQAATAARNGTGSRTSQSGSGKQKGSSRCSGEGPGNVIPALIVEGDRAMDDSALDRSLIQSKYEKDYNPTLSYKRFGRRLSSHVSRSSVGTVSYLDPSTKQTSLFPSSGFTPTPRGSFQRSVLVDQGSASQTDVFPAGLFYGTSLTTQGIKDSSPMFLAPPTLLTNLSKTQGTGFEEEGEGLSYANEVSCAEDESEENVITLLCPSRSQPRYSRNADLLTLQEQSDSNSTDNKDTQSSPMKEVVRINVHVYDNTSTQETNENQRQLVSTEAESNAITSSAQSLDSENSMTPGQEPYAHFMHDIPFADEEEECEQPEYSHIGGSPDRHADNSEKQTVMTTTTFNEKKADNNNRIEGLETNKEGTSELLLPHSGHRGSSSVPLKRSSTRGSHKGSTSADVQQNGKGVKRRLSFYPGFKLRRRNTTAKTLHGIYNPHKRRFSHREANAVEEKIKQPRKHSHNLPDPEQSSTNLSDMDDFAHISRLVAIDAIKKLQARERAMSVGSEQQSNVLDSRKQRQSSIQSPSLPLGKKCA